MRPFVRRRWLHALSTAMLLTTSSVAGASDGRPSSAEALQGYANPKVAEKVRDEAFSLLDRVATLTKTGRLSDAITASARLAKKELPEVHDPSSRVAAPRGVPHAIADEVSRLLTAIERAKMLAPGSKVSGGVLPPLKAPAISDPLTPLSSLEGNVPSALLRDRWVDSGLRASAPTPANLQASRIDARTFAAASEVAQALDAVLGALRSYGARREMPPHASKRRAAECDLVDHLPALCIGDVDKNRYTKDAELLIDLGGKDTYTNSAGGADPEVGNGLDVSVNIDVGGNDRYIGKLPLKSKARVAQGAAADGGIGFLFDAEGNDTYKLSSKPAVAGPRSLGAVGQGAGYVSGVGVLADLAGKDTYRLTSRSQLSTLGIYGAGSGAGSAAGILVDGGGRDSYRALASPKASTYKEGQTQVQAAAFGAGVLGGVGLLADNDTDKNSMTLETRKRLALSRREIYKDGAASLAVGFGAANGTGSAGALILGEGDTSAVARADMTIKGDRSDLSWGAGASVVAFGAGVGGLGGLHDSGGNDRYVALSRPTVSSSVFIFQPPLVRVSAAGAATVAMGAGSAGVGVLRELGGDDSYVARADARGQRRSLAASQSLAHGAGYTGVGALHDSTGADGYASHAASDGYTAAVAGSVAQAVGSTGAGFLLDEVGGDSYSSEAVGHIDVYIADDRWGDGGSVSYAQAGGFTGYGELRDLGGADSYVSKNAFSLGVPSRPFIENPQKNETNAFSIVQAAVSTGVASLYDADDGARDAFEQKPEYPACLGTRGTSTWRDCGDLYGEGTVKDS